MQNIHLTISNGCQVVIINDYIIHMYMYNKLKLKLLTWIVCLISLCSTYHHHNYDDEVMIDKELQLNFQQIIKLKGSLGMFILYPLF